MTTKERAPRNTALAIALEEGKRKHGRRDRIATLAKLTQVRLSQILNGHRKATAIEQERLAKVLGKSVGELGFPVIDHV